MPVRSTDSSTANARRPRQLSAAAMQAMCERFNAEHPIGSEIKVWTGPREGAPAPRIVRDPGACILGGHTPVVYVSGGGGCIALTHVQS